MILALGVHGAEVLARLLGGKVRQLIKAGNIGVVGHAVHFLHIAHVQRRGGNPVNGHLHAGDDDIGIVIQYGGVVRLGVHHVFVGGLVGLYPALAHDQIAAGGDGQADEVLFGVKVPVGLAPVLGGQAQLLLGEYDGLTGDDGLHVGVIGRRGTAGVAGLVPGGNRERHGANHQHSQCQCKCFFHGTFSFGVKSFGL